MRTWLLSGCGMFVCVCVCVCVWGGGGGGGLSLVYLPIFPVQLLDIVCPDDTLLMCLCHNT